jgi:nitroreductase
MRRKRMFMNFKEVINKRRSVRDFLPDAVPDEVLREMLEAARLAPSGGNGQNWYFGVVRDEVTKKELAKAAGGQDWIAEAPVIIACCAKLGEDLGRLPEDDFGLIVNKTRFGEEFINYMNSYPDRKMANIFWENAAPLIPGEHIFLSAISHGLNACWVGYLDVRKASEILSLPEDIACLFLMPVGYARQRPKEIDRKPFEEIVFYEKWNKDI